MAFRYFKDGSWVDPNKVPTGGVAGQVLAKTTATDYDVSWQIPGLLMPPPKVNEFIQPLSVGVGGNAAPPQDEIQAQATFIQRPITIDRILVDVRSAGSSPCEGRLGIYGSNSDLQPGDLIVDAGTFSATTTGIKNITLSPTVTLPYGIVFLCVVRQTANQFFINCSQNADGPFRGVEEASALGGAGNSPNVWGARQTGVSGALPATFSATSDRTFRVFRIGVRVASVL